MPVGPSHSFHFTELSNPSIPIPPLPVHPFLVLSIMIFPTHDHKPLFLFSSIPLLPRANFHLNNSRPLSPCHSLHPSHSPLSLSPLIRNNNVISNQSLEIETCRLITGCIRPTATPDLYVLSGTAPPEIRRNVHCQNERTSDTASITTSL